MISQPNWTTLPTPPTISDQPALTGSASAIQSNPLFQGQVNFGQAPQTGQAQQQIMQAMAEQTNFNDELKQQEMDLQQAQQLFNQQQQQPGLLDFLSLGLEGAKFLDPSSLWGGNINTINPKGS